MRATEEVVQCFAHCKNPMCPGYAQEPVDAVVTTTEYTYKDNGGDLPGTERSNRDLRFADDEERACRACKQPRELSADARPSYQNLSTFDPMGLVNGSVAAFNPGQVNTEADTRVAALEAQMAKQAEMIDKLVADKAV